ncbi:hypothetical protein DF185_07855 [Marinifilum breve]|uniref:Schlafen AlbA-2 domain-containing protein n=1 Tax=Marinifilum breve TaxID=2184082 RepID=A0A2V3ZY53_9BACT|nr:ATP-binding protein [Marinifilum breve]PXY01389.1 hypothetical protein DF185_07855 [Marinifilum breve]
MKEKVIEIIKYYPESHNVDFKKEQYPIQKHYKKHEIIKDISAMANHPSNEDKFIIIGVKEKNGTAAEFYNIDELIDQANYQQYLDSHIEPKINFEYRSIDFEGYTLAYFRIFDNKDRPYILKKNVQNSMEQNKTEFKEGDGFIRVGTSTKRLMRADYDNIYKTKFENPDRKDDIEIIPVVRNCTTDDLSFYDLRYFDIDLVNRSNKSIDLDIEMKIFFSGEPTIISEERLKKKLPKKESLSSYTNYSFSSVAADTLAFKLRLNVVEYDEYIFVERTKMRFEKCAISIPQESLERNVFLKELVLVEKPYSIKGEVIIRSDEFTSGLLKKEFEYKI